MIVQVLFAALQQHQATILFLLYLPCYDCSHTEILLKASSLVATVGLALGDIETSVLPMDVKLLDMHCG